MPVQITNDEYVVNFITRLPIEVKLVDTGIGVGIGDAITLVGENNTCTDTSIHVDTGVLLPDSQGSTDLHFTIGRQVTLVGVYDVCVLHQGVFHKLQALKMVANEMPLNLNPPTSPQPSPPPPTPPPPYPPGSAFGAVSAAAFTVPVSIGVPSDSQLEEARVRVLDQMSFAASNVSNVVIRARKLVTRRRRKLTTTFDDVSALGSALSTLNTTGCFNSVAGDEDVVVVELEYQGINRADFDAFIAATTDGTLNFNPESSNASTTNYFECAHPAVLTVEAGVPPPPPLPLSNENLGSTPNQDSSPYLLCGLIILLILAVALAVWVFTYFFYYMPNTVTDKNGRTTINYGWSLSDLFIRRPNPTGVVAAKPRRDITGRRRRGGRSGSPSVYYDALDRSGDIAKAERGIAWSADPRVNKDSGGATAFASGHAGQEVGACGFKWDIGLG